MIHALKAFPKEPVFEQIQDPRKFAVAGNAYGDGLVIFQHDQKNWMMIINTPSEEVVANVVQRALPHAKTSALPEIHVWRC